jgi:predicted peptidase
MDNYADHKGNEVVATKAVDPTRVYLTGLSMGGFGAFDLAARRPELFAAVVPICGGGDPATAAKVARVPFYIVHGTDDPVVPVALSRAMREAIAGAAAEAARADRAKNREQIPGAPDAPPSAPKPMPKRAPNPMYREYDKVGHDSWTPAYRFGDDGVLDWMFAQRRNA